MNKTEVRDLVLNILGLERTYKPRFLVQNSSLLYKNSILDIISKRIITDSHFTFIQAGGFDGVSNDLLKPIIDNFNIKGLIIEPQLKAFNILKKNLSNKKRIQVLHAGVSEKDCVKDFFYTKSHPSQVCSVDRKHLLRHKIPPNDIGSKKVNFYSLDSILKMYSFNRFDFLQVDAEGHDYEIIKSLYKMKIMPEIVRFESSHMDNKKLNKILNDLSLNKYNFIVEKRDITAIRMQAN